MLAEFKKFVLQGNVLDLAIGVVIGATFGKIVTSLVNDILMPPIGLVLGRVDFTSLFINLGPQPFASLKDAKAAGAPVIAYGIFINNIIDFLIVAFVIFLIIRQVNRLMPPAAPPVTTKDCPHCASKIPSRPADAHSAPRSWPQCEGSWYGIRHLGRIRPSGIGLIPV